MRAQAKHFLDVVRDSGATLPPVLDFELATGPALYNLDAAARWVDVVADATGREPMLYTGPAFFRDLCRMAGVAGVVQGDQHPRMPQAHAAHDELLGGLGHHDLHSGPRLDELAAKIGRLVASHASTQTQNNVFASKLIHGREFSRPQRGQCAGPQEREGSAHL